MMLGPKPPGPHAPKPLPQPFSALFTAWRISSTVISPSLLASPGGARRNVGVAQCDGDHRQQLINGHRSVLATITASRSRQRH